MRIFPLISTILPLGDSQRVGKSFEHDTIVRLKRSRESSRVGKSFEPIGVVDSDFDFSETLTEKENGWSLEKRCGQNAISGGSKDQRGDKACPNVIIINTDDMAWGDLSINNPSKLIPTPNIDKMVTRGINFR